MKDTEAEFEFKDAYLRNLARTMSLDEAEKITINSLNDINVEILKELVKSKEAYYQGSTNYDYSKLEETIVKEKELIKSNLDKLIKKDSSGARMLKIFEHIVASDSGDKTFGKLQQRKAILISDYFLDKPLGDMDKVLYICERGKNNLEIELINKKINSNSLKNTQEALELKSVLYYKKVLLDNYYKARNISNDNYFVDSSIKETSLPDVVIGVTNLLVRQALTLLRKDELNFAQRNELEAIIGLCTSQQLTSIKNEIDKFDGRQKRNANKLIQEIIKNK